MVNGCCGLSFGFLCLYHQHYPEAMLLLGVFFKTCAICKCERNLLHVQCPSAEAHGTIEWNGKASKGKQVDATIDDFNCGDDTIIWKRYPK